MEWDRRFRTALFFGMILIAAPGCRSVDPACPGVTAASFTPTAERYRTMSRAERGEEARRFNALAARCGWEP